MKYKKNKLHSIFKDITKICCWLKESCMGGSYNSIEQRLKTNYLDAAHCCGFFLTVLVENLQLLYRAVYIPKVSGSSKLGKCYKA